MRNFIMYNANQKYEYMNTIENDGTRENVGYTFQRIREIEEEKGKDICKFNSDELAEVWSNFRAKSLAAIYSRVSIISKYINFCIEKLGDSDINYNWAKGTYFNEENLKRFVSKVATKKKVIVREELEDIAEFCANFQDAAIFVGLFEGLRGRPVKEFSFEELRNLKMSDCNTETNYIIARQDDGETRLIKVSDFTMDIFVKSYNQKVYLMNNGQATGWFKEADLIDSEYIFKTSEAGREGDNSDSRVTAQLIRRRMKNISEKYGNKFLTPNNLVLSGMVDFAKQMKEQKGEELTNKDYEKICEQFNIDPVRYYKVKVEVKNYL